MGWTTFLPRGTWVTSARCQYLVVIGANHTFLAADVVLADAATCHLFAVLSDGAEERAAARWNIRMAIHWRIDRNQSVNWILRIDETFEKREKQSRSRRKSVKHGWCFDRPYVCILDVPRWFSASPNSQACTCRISDHPRQVCTRTVRSPGCRCQKHCLTCCSCTNSGNLRH